MKKPQAIVLAAGVVYLAALAAAWWIGTGHAMEKTVRLLGQSERVFVESNGDAVDAVLLHSCGAIMNELGNTAKAVPLERMRELADRFCVDEIDIAGTNGVTIASTNPFDIGYDYRSYPQTLPFLELLRGRKYLSQPFRKGTTNPDKYRKYLGMPFADGSGFMEIGLDFSRVVKVLQDLDAEALREWRIGQTGHFDFYDADGDGLCDASRREETDGDVTGCEELGRTVYLRPFTYAGCRFVSVLPEREYFGERDLNFAIMAPALAVVVLFLAYFVFSMSRAAERDRIHREAEDAVRSRDLAMAKTIQLSVLPSLDAFRKNVFSLSIAAATSPAREVGGDFYDLHPLDKVHMAIVMADVSGKGIPAAMFMMKAKNEIYNALCAEHDLSIAVAKANARICEHNEAELFVTAWIGVLDIRSGEMEYVNAGHDRPFIRRADGSVEKAAGKGCRFLGMFPDAEYRVDHLAFSAGDSFFLFTDGVTEAMNPARELFGEARLVRALSAAAAEPAELVESVRSAVRDFAAGAEQSDDLTTLAFVWHGVGGRSERTFAAEEASLGPAMEWLGGEIGLTDRKDRARLLNAADEMMTNIVNYSGSAEFVMTVENAPGRTRLTFTDSGREYNPLSHVDPDVHVPLAERPEGGLGILITKRLIDAVAYSRESGRNIISVVKFSESGKLVDRLENFPAADESITPSAKK